MARYTNYDDLLKKWHDLGLDEISKIHKVNAFNHFIKNLPTADVVEVVRCGKCKHGEVSIISKSKDGEETIACYCTIKNKVTDDDYYCPSGERSDT